jgi:hypothetical protein
MPFFRRTPPNEPPEPEPSSGPLSLQPPPPGETDDVKWWAVAESQYKRHWRSYLGSPETLAAGGQHFYDSGQFGTALLLYQKAIDVLHTHYVFSSMQDRQPSPRDLPIIDGFVSALGASLSLHPGAPVADSVREVTHRLRTTSSACQRVGLPADLYLRALDDLARTASHVNVDDIFW